MNIFKIIQNWAQDLVNNWEEDEHKQRVRSLRSTATLLPKVSTGLPMPNINPPPTYPKPPAPPCPPKPVPTCTRVIVEGWGGHKVIEDKPEKPKLTEPVELIIKAMKERPETFEIGYTFWDTITRCRGITLKDTVTGLTLRFRQSIWGHNESFKSMFDLWITEDDAKAIKEQLDAIQKKQQENEKVAQDIAQEQQRLKVVEMYKENV